METKRNLDGVYFRVKRNGKWQNICFSDLTTKEMNEVLKDRNKTWLKELCKILGNTIHEIGEQLDIVVGYEEDTQDNMEEDN